MGIEPTSYLISIHFTTMPHPAAEGGACMEKAMNVEISTVTKLLITGAEGLDPISVYLEDLSPCKGKITVSCYDKT